MLGHPALVAAVVVVVAAVDLELVEAGLAVVQLSVEVLIQMDTVHGVMV